MRRRTFTAVSALSLLLCMAGVAMWMRSYSTEYNLSLELNRDALGESIQERSYSASAWCGTLDLTAGAPDTAGAATPGGGHRSCHLDCGSDEVRDTITPHMPQFRWK